MNLDTSSINWIDENLQIINKNGQLVPLHPNDGQLMLAGIIQKQRDAGFPVRILLLKPRQVGWSTWSEAEAFYEINARSHWTALCVSADTESTDMVFNMTRTFQSHLPQDMRRTTRASNRKEIVYREPHGSKFLTQTAGKDVLGRGGTIHFFHGSEVAFWPKAKEGLAAVLQMVPKNPDTIVVLETTANGVGGAFYDMYWQAVDRMKDKDSLEGYLPIFFPWHKFSEYSTEPPPDFVPDEDEKVVQSECGLTDGQVYWRRLKIQELGGDEAMFRQEYPATAMEAFQTSGNPVFLQSMIQHQKQFIREPRRCMFTQDKIEDVQRVFNCWKIRQLPCENHEYAIGIDTMEARLSDVNDPKSNLDCDAVAVFDRTAGEYVAFYHGRGDQVELAWQVYYAAMRYNEAFIAPEIPNSMTLLNIFKEKGYENIYNRQVHDQQLTTQDSENLGWRTDMVTRKWLVDDFRSALREKSFVVGFEEIIGEMMSFCYDKSGKPIHMSGKHDDLLFAAMIAFQVHLRCPIGVKPYQHAFTGGEPERHEGLESLARIGAIDKGIEDDDDYDDYFTD